MPSITSAIGGVSDDIKVTRSTKFNVFTSYSYIVVSVKWQYVGS